MKKFIINIFIFFIVVAGIDLIFGLLIHNLRSSAKSGLTEKYHTIFHNLDADVLIMGSSRASHHYNPIIFEEAIGLKTYNCGQDATGIDFHYASLSRILAYHNPQIIIYDPFAAYDMEDGITNLANLKVWHDLPEISNNLDSFNDVGDNLKLKSSFYAYNSSFLNIIGDNILEAQDNDIKGYRPLYGRMDYENPWYDMPTIKWNEKKLHKFISFINLCKKNDIKLIVCISPAYHTRSSRGYVELIKLCQMYEVLVIDMYAASTFVDDREYFEDTFHLNHVGADKFSHQLSDSLKFKLKYTL